MLFEQFHSIMEKKEVLQIILSSDISIISLYDELKLFKPQMLNSAFIQAHIEGNFTQSEAEALFNYALDTFSGVKDNQAKTRLPRIRKIKIPTGLKVENFNERSPMSYTVLSWQIGKVTSMKMAAM